MGRSETTQRRLGRRAQSGSNRAQLEIVQDDYNCAHRQTIARGWFWGAHSVRQMDNRPGSAKVKDGNPARSITADQRTSGKEMLIGSYVFAVRYLLLELELHGIAQILSLKAAATKNVHRWNISIFLENDYLPSKCLDNLFAKKNAL